MREANHCARPLRLRMCACLVIVAGAECTAGVTTIHEGGPTVPIGQYLSAFFTQENESSIDPVAGGSTALPVAFPVRTGAMRPGHLPSPLRMPAARWLATPMFLLGDDPLSRGWLAANRQRLQRAGASGLVVNVETLEAFRGLRATAPELPMAMGCADDFARQAGLSIYPLYVSVDGQVSQQVP